MDNKKIMTRVIAFLSGKEKKDRQMPWEWVITSAFFIVITLLGLMIYKDYGVAWDTVMQQIIGANVYRYVFENDLTLLSEISKYYGAAYEAFIYAITQNMEAGEVFLTRNLVTHLFFILSLLVFYFLLKRYVRAWWLALLGCIFLYLSPRIFSDTFYNSKDIPFMIGYILIFYALIRYLDDGKRGNIIFMGIATAYTAAIRMPALMVLPIVLGIMGLEVVFKWNLEVARKKLLDTLLYVGVMLVFIYILYPIFWHDPINGITNAFLHFFEFQTDIETYYRGTYFNSNQLPWHYLPIWILITTPVLFTVLCGIGAVFSTWQIVTCFRQDSLRVLKLLSAALWFLFPALIVIVLRSPQFDGWRHMYFIYPPMIIFAVIGIQELLDIKINRLPKQTIALALGLLIFAGLLDPLSFMVRYHPYEHIYFSWITGEDMASLKRAYDLDYWGLSYKEGLEFLVQYKPEENIRLKVENLPGVLNAFLLSDQDQDRLDFVEEIEKAQYYITNYRSGPKVADFPPEQEIYAVKIGNASILSVFKQW